MKILYLITSLENGGTQFVIPKIVEVFQRLGHSVEIVSCEARDMLGACRLDEAGLSYTVMANRKRSKIRNIISLVQMVRKSRPDVIWTSLSAATFVGQIAGKLTGVPVVSWKHSATVRSYTKAIQNFSELWIADSATVARFLETDVGVQKSRIMTWPLYCCDVSVMVPEYWKGDGVLRLGSIGRLAEQKNYFVLLEGLRLFRERNPARAERVCLAIVGEGHQRNELQSMINRHDMQREVSLLGLLSKQDTAAFLGNLHLYLQPSLFEGMCLAAHEAMAAGLPVMATPVGELQKSVREHETGFVLTEALPEMICASLEKIFSDPSVLERMGKQAMHEVRTLYGPETFQKNGALILEKISKELVRA
ncbi:glycosyltransferase family 4 protein [Acetobacter sp.]|uniref:glycosyltransferase family 4 protein n=1 Tax=Acetobacter sp. TaxID=440 RepID=UPI0025BFD4DC|nr:glycosyltransferase family 4 protein [Acetobacter sp.]MCH4091949.1 glycosyltransferase family 4 protein [Acetobacter sp.]MCI1301131.1 glycosyltransferase family 4 protein [Acetobacter sp.]MCI1317324.1 glycosyltransferase family 4 protein [Acetobacter sp.]